MKRPASDVSARKSSRRLPKQDRSRKTYDALLDAAERLLKEQPWEKISTVAIMAEAGCSNGAIYGRFKNKDDLLVGLYERHDRHLKERFRSEMERRSDEDLDLEAFLDRELDRLIANLYENRWLLRAMGLLSRTKPEVVSESVRRERKEMLDRIAGDVLNYSDEFDHPEPARAAELTVFFVSTILRESILYQGPHSGTLGLEDEELKSSMKRLAMSFLGIKKI